MLTVLDLFSGIGGFTLGLERTGGFRTVAFCESAEYPRKVLEKHWPLVPIHDDVRTLRTSDICHVDLVCGGFPCTQTSVAAAIHGRRAGLAGKDSGLWYEMLRIVHDSTPAWVLVENPPGVSRWESEIQGGLEDLGYRVSRLETTALSVGLPHIRKRYIYAANRDGQGLAVPWPSGPPTTYWCERLTATGGCWLADTPGTCGGMDGIPNRMDRIVAVGSSVVPQVVERIGRAILDSMVE